jgi:hypothetical protein
MTTAEVDAGSVRESEASAETSRKWGRGKGETRNGPAPASGAVYGLGMIGALVYFIRKAETRQDYVLAVGKAVVWPALLVYLAFRRLGA